jgi:hypothetical protein
MTSELFCDITQLSKGSPVSTFRDNQSVPSSWVKKSLKMGLIGCPETSVQDYLSTLRNISEERRFYCGDFHEASLIGVCRTETYPDMMKMLNMWTEF